MSSAMSLAAPVQKAAPKSRQAVTAKTKQAAGASPFLQRKCACGAATSSASDECDECRTKKIVGLQTKLRVNEPGDAYEQEADRVAEQVLAKPAHPGVTSAPVRIQRFSAQSSGPMSAAPASVEHVLAGPGQPLEPALRHDMEQRFGHDFSRVRVHSDRAADRSAREVDAHAYTVGQNIVFAASQFAPGTREGRRLIAHELAHVVQQSRSREMSLQRQRRGAAAGCGICMNDPGGRNAGDIAHQEVQDAFIAANPNIVAERPVPGIPNARLDLSYERTQSGQRVLFIGEIKPLDDAGQQAASGRDQLRDYTREIRESGEFGEIFRMRDSPPPGPLYFDNPMNPAGCPRQVINVQRTEYGLYQYYCEPPFSALVTRRECRCAPEDEPRGEGEPTGIWTFDRPVQGADTSKSTGKGEGAGKGNGQPGKGNGEPGKSDGRRKPGKPGRRPWGPEISATTAAIIAGLAALALFLGKFFKPLRLAELLGALLGALLRFLRFALAVLAGAAPAVSAASGPPTGPPAGEPIPRTVPSAPSAGTTPPTGTTVPPAGTAPPVGAGVQGTTSPPIGATAPPTRATPSPGTAPRPGRASVPRAQEKQPPGRAPALRPAAKARTIRISVIDGLNPATFSVGRTSIVLLDPGGPNEALVFMQATKKVTEGKGTTVSFISLEECKGGRCSGGGNIYTVTHPYRPSDEPAMAGVAIPRILSRFLPSTWNLDALADALDGEGRKAEANMARELAQQLKQMAEGGSR